MFYIVVFKIVELLTYGLEIIVSFKNSIWS